MVPPSGVVKPPASGPTQKSVALQTGESISENSQTVYTSAKDEGQATRSNSDDKDCQNPAVINAKTSKVQRTSLETASTTEDSIADISFSFASQQTNQQSMFLSNHYGPDKLLHGTYALGVNRSASFHTGDQLKIDSPSTILRIPRSQAFYPGVYVWSHRDDVEVSKFPPTQPM